MIQKGILATTNMFKNEVDGVGPLVMMGGAAG
jgi:hypothetical protein